MSRDLSAERMNFNGTILLVDDEAHIRKFVGLILKQLGSPRLLEAPNGQEAVAIYQKENPDLVLLDINMPVMDGLETLKKLREIDPDALVTVKRGDVEFSQTSKTSMMPEGLLDTLNKDEILDLIAYLKSGGNPQSALFQSESAGKSSH